MINFTEAEKLLNQDMKNVLGDATKDLDYNFDGGIKVDYIDNDNNTTLQRKANANQALNQYIDNYAMQMLRTNSPAINMNKDRDKDMDIYYNNRIQ